MKFNGFIATLFVAIIAAYFFPNGPEILPLKTITDIGIAFIFFFYGLKLSPEEFKLGFLNYRSHILIQTTTFLVFPLLTLAFTPVFGGAGSDFWIALFFLGALPSTVSSSIVMVSLAKGNLPTAIFNASLSGLIGIFATPLWMGIFLGDSGEFQFGNVVMKLFLQIVLPLVIGLSLQKFLGQLAKKYSKELGLFDKSIIVLIVYSSFSASFATNFFASVSPQNFIYLFGAVILIFFIVYYGLGLICKVLDINIEDTIAIKFCGTKKSLVHASVMVKIIFGNAANTGLFLLPIMLYHISQLLIVALYAERYRKREDAIT